MAEELKVSPGSKTEKYDVLLPQIVSLMQAESDHIARMANAAAALMSTFHHLWIGFYRVVGGELVLGPFQGPLACTRIAFGRGVCGSAWKERRAILVPDVELFPGHIACSSSSKSEIVVPAFDGDKVVAILDIDSEHLYAFDEIDAHYLKLIVKLVFSE